MSLKSYLKYNLDNGVDTLYEEAPIDRTTAAEAMDIVKNILSEKSNDTANISTNKPINSPMQSNNMKLNQGENSSARALADKAKTIEELKQMVMEFKGCPLKLTAKNTVFADGPSTAKIMFIGEAPGANEDLEGIPFCGQSGKLLNNILLSVGLKREDVYITNTVFWRPPANRRPTPAELDICRPFVEKHIALLNPEIIVLVGATAVEALLSSEISMHDIRSSFYDYKNSYLQKPSIKTAVIFHPSYLLRQQYKKKLMWYDMLKIQQATNSNQ